ncbi:hypothetical protein [Elizabethkingia anophelis]|uniref:hypothetical protein n=1 Tax=Elizabethkingia anophelis TaxID=1117645 RepID=UPI00372F3750
MKPISSYLNFLKKQGRPLLEINPGIAEIALTVADAIQALGLLEGSEVAILGGDILSEGENRELIYAYQFWGDRQEYHYLNWYCNKENNETQEDYAKRSYIVARESISEANDVAKRIDEKCYIILVI